MKKTIEQLTTAFGVDPFLAGGCGAFAVVLYEVAALKEFSHGV